MTTKQPPRSKAMSTPLHAASPKRTTLHWHHNPLDVDDPCLVTIQDAVDAINLITTERGDGQVEPSVVLTPDGQVFVIYLTASAEKADPNFTREVIEAARAKELYEAK
jgi:hypothetical protein